MTKSPSRSRSASLSDAEFLAILLERPDWAAGLPLGGKVHSGPHYLEEPDEPALPLAVPDPDAEVLEQAIDVYLDDTRQDIGEIDDPALVEREDDEDYVANLADHVAPLTELVEPAACRPATRSSVHFTRTSSPPAPSIPIISTVSAAASTAAGWIG